MIPKGTLGLSKLCIFRSLKSTQTHTHLETHSENDKVVVELSWPPLNCFSSSQISITLLCYVNKFLSIHKCLSCSILSLTLNFVLLMSFLSNNTWLCMYNTKRYNLYSFFVSQYFVHQRRLTHTKEEV